MTCVLSVSEIRGRIWWQWTVRLTFVGGVCLLWDLHMWCQLLSLVTSVWKVQIVYLLHCAYHWSLCGCSCFSMLCAVSSFHTDEGVATPDSSLDFVCNCLYYLALRMHNLLYFTVLQAIFTKLVISCCSTTDLNLWYHSLKQLGQQHNFCLALSFPFYLLIFPDTSKFHTAELCLLQCYSILIAGALLMFHRIVVLSSSGSDSSRRGKATIICLSVSDSVLINMEEHPGRLEY